MPGHASDTANVVQLEGRVSGAPEVKDLPSGDRLVVMNVVVERPDGTRSDSLPVAVGPSPGRGRQRRPGQPTSVTVKRAAALEVSDRVRVEGWLQRRFWSGPDGRRTRLQVVASEVRRLTS